MPGSPAQLNSKWNIPSAKNVSRVYSNGPATSLYENMNGTFPAALLLLVMAFRPNPKLPPGKPPRARYPDKNSSLGCAWNSLVAVASQVLSPGTSSSCRVTEMGALDMSVRRLYPLISCTLRQYTRKSFGCVSTDRHTAWSEPLSLLISTSTSSGTVRRPFTISRIFFGRLKYCSISAAEGVSMARQSFPPRPPPPPVTPTPAPSCLARGWH
mmetsp:Transcript_35603/g.88969  ORF Transcript_35603/g.88969 Transcript_35603/m.88969 type:complete len:212 (-) Transcript_35603:51-686(-)